MGNEVILNPSEQEPVSTEEVLARFNSWPAEIAEALRKRAEQRQYDKDEVEATLDYLKGKSEILAQGLLPAADHAFLSGIIEQWFSMAETSARFSNESETSDRVIRRAVDAIHVSMVVNNLISEEAKAELNQRWPVQEEAESTG